MAALRTAANPLFPLMLDVPQDQILLARLDDARLTAASFLDQRVLGDDIARQWAAWNQMPAATGDTARLRFIFHIGHAGSTLISRLLGHHAQVQSLREPLLLRTLADIMALDGGLDCPWSPENLAGRRAQILGWLAEAGDPAGLVLVKATSFVSAIADTLRPHDSPALFLYLPLADYLAAILAGPASLAETQTMAPQRMARIARMLPNWDQPLWALGLIERIAMSWLCEMLTASRALNRTDTACLWMDFEQFLRDPHASLTALHRHFGLAIDDAGITSLLRGPLMQRYSKAPEYGYDEQMRSDAKAEAKTLHGAAIAQALRWVGEQTRRYPELATLPGLPV